MFKLVIRKDEPMLFVLLHRTSWRPVHRAGAGLYNGTKVGHCEYMFIGTLHSAFNMLID